MIHSRNLFPLLLNMKVHGVPVFYFSMMSCFNKRTLKISSHEMFTESLAHEIKTNFIDTISHFAFLQYNEYRVARKALLILECSKR